MSSLPVETVRSNPPPSLIEPMEKVKINCKKCGVDNRFSAATPEELAGIRAVCNSCGVPLKLPGVEELLRWKERSRDKEQRRRGFSRLLICSFFYFVTVGLQALLVGNTAEPEHESISLMTVVCGGLALVAVIMALLAAQGLYRFLTPTKQDEAEEIGSIRAIRIKNFALTTLLTLLLAFLPAWIFYNRFFAS